MADRWHLDFLDSQRGIAVMGVILVHSSILNEKLFDLGWPLQAICFSGQRGVQLFFVVSAFTLYLSHQNRRAEHHPTRNFFIRRVCRIAPMFYVAAVIDYLFMRSSFGTIQEAWPSLLLLHGLSSHAIKRGPVGGWSVADEVLFYLCLPLCFRWVKNLRTVLVALCISAPALYLGAHFLIQRVPGGKGFIGFTGFPIEIPVFLMGIAGYFVWRDFIKPPCRRDLSFALLAAAVLLYFSFLPFDNSTLYGTSFVSLLLLLSLSMHPWPMIVNTTTRFLGKVSYSIYLLHFPILHGVQQWILIHGPGWSTYLKFGAAFLGTSLVTIPLSYCAWRWIETPGIHLGRALIAWLESPTRVRRLFIQS